MKWLSLILLFSYQAFALLPDEKNTVEIYKKSKAAVVNVTSVTLKRDFFFEVIPAQGQGSGAFIRKDGYIVTNNHVLGGAYEVRVTLNDKSEHPAKVIGRDPDTDLAVIKIDPKKASFQTLSLSRKSPDVGQKVMAIGNPFGLGGSLSVGVVSALERDIRAETDRVIKGVIQTDAAINPGNSGGPLLNSSGEIIGINAQIVSPSGASAGIGFAIPVDTVKKITSQLIQFGQVLRPYIGVEGVGFGPSLLRELKVPSRYGVMVIGVDPKGPARKAGLREARKYGRWGFREIPLGGDIIYQINGRPVSTMRDLQDIIFEKKIGQSITVHYIRKNRKLKTTIKLGPPPGVREKSL